MMNLVQVGLAERRILAIYGEIVWLAERIETTFLDL